MNSVTGSAQVRFSVWCFFFVFSMGDGGLEGEGSRRRADEAGSVGRAKRIVRVRVRRQ